MSKLLSILTTVAAMSICGVLVYAQEASPAQNMPLASANLAENKPTGLNDEPKPAKPGASSVAAASLASPEGQPEPTPQPRKRSFLEWLFGSRRGPEATPAPWPRVAPTPTPKPAKATPKPKATNEKPGHRPQPFYPSETTPKPVKPAASPKAEKVPGVTPAPPEPTATPPAKKTPKTKPSTPNPSATTRPGEPSAEEEAETKEKLRFESAKSKANDDPQIKSLKAKADEATTEEESKAALRAYNKALFEKVKKIDPSVSEWADRLLAAILKRLNE